MRPSTSTTTPIDEQSGRTAEWWGVAAWATLVVVALVWGAQAVAESGVSLRAAPLSGHWAWHGGPGLLPAVLVGTAVAAWGPRLAARVEWRAVLWSTAGASAAWTVALAASDGWARLTAPLANRHEYEPFATGVVDLGDFVSRYTDDLLAYPVHVQSHPPGPVAVAWVLDRAGLGGAGWLALLVVAGWGVAAAAALIAAREVAGEKAARRAAPVMAVLPAAVWAGTSVDALFAGLGAIGVALSVLAVTRASRPLALGAGGAMGVALLFSYGAALLLVIPLAVAVAYGLVGGRRPVAVLAGWAALGVGGVLALPGIAGFWWFEGLAATREAYWAGIGADRPAGYLTLAGNPGALAMAGGPAVAAGLAAVLSRARAAWRPALLPGAGLAAVVVADLSQMSRGEVERLWLPFVPWLALAAPGDRRGWVAAQVALALVLQSALRSPW
jgi:hypothetical protein